MRGSFLTTCSRMKRPIRNGSVPPECDQMKRMSGQWNAVPALPKIRLAMVRVVSVANSIELGPHAIGQMGAAGRIDRVGIDHGLTPIELLEHRHEGLVAEIFVAVAGVQADAVGLEHVERIFDLAQRAFGIGQRNGGEQPKRPGLSLRSCAPYSLQARASERPSSTSPNQTPGGASDSTAVVTPAFSMSASDDCSDHLGA